MVRFASNGHFLFFSAWHTSDSLRNFFSWEKKNPKTNKTLIFGHQLKKLKWLKAALNQCVQTQLKLYSKGQEAAGRGKGDAVKCTTCGKKTGGGQPADGRNHP